MGSPIVKRVKQFSPRGPWLIHTLQVKQISAYGFSPFPERVWPLGTDLLRLPRGQGWAGHSSLLVACTSALDFFSALRSVYFFSNVKGARLFPLLYF